MYQELQRNQFDKDLVQWAKDLQIRTAEELFTQCPRADWLMDYLQSLDEEPRLLCRAGISMARTVLPTYRAAYPGDTRLAAYVTGMSDWLQHRTSDQELIALREDIRTHMSKPIVPPVASPEALQHVCTLMNVVMLSFIGVPEDLSLNGRMLAQLIAEEHVHLRGTDLLTEHAHLLPGIRVLPFTCAPRQPSVPLDL